MTKTKLLAIFNVLSFLGTITVNGLANALPINGMNTGQISALYPNAFVPAGFTFSIWGLIYLALTFFSIYQCGVFLKKEMPIKIVETLGTKFILTNVFNMLWILLWHYGQIELSVVVMLSLLITLIAIHLKLEIPNRNRNFIQRLSIDFPFSLYLGWIMIATVANFAALFVSLGWQGQPLTGENWAVIMISVATLLNLLLLLTRHNRIMPLVAIWSLYGILGRQQTLSESNIVITACYTCMLILAAGIVYDLVMQNRLRPLQTPTNP